jgi:FkbM family methyltransferase
MIPIVHILNYLGYRCLGLAEKCNRSTYPAESKRQYLKEDPNEMKVVTFPSLNPASLVVDVGGYTGDWAQRIYSRYSCHIDIYEPHPILSRRAKANFEPNKKVRVFEIGLSNINGMTELFGDDRGASLVKDRLRESHIVNIFKASEIFNRRYESGIDLLKLNVEGAEYKILPDLIKNYDMRKINDILIQFHRNSPDYNSQRDKIWAGLSITHSPVFNYDYIFEHWKLVE